MSTHHSFVSDLAIVLGVAAAVSLVFKRTNLPLLLGYLMAGVLVGPYIPIPILADMERVETLSEFGVILVMFVVGLELRLGRLAKVLPTAGLTALVEVGGMLLSGFLLARALGWSTVEGVFLGGCLAISSTMVVSKVFEQNPVAEVVREHVFSVLVLQDIIAIALITALTAVAAGQGLSAGALAVTVGELVGVLVALVVGGLLIVPRIVRTVVRSKNDELLVVVALGVCFAFALLAESLGYSVALGSFVAGVLIAESGHGKQIEHLTQPIKDIFAAVFFVSIGMLIDPVEALTHLPTSLLIALVIIVMQFLSVSFAGVLSGNGLQRSIVAGLALGQIGEFAFIIAAVGASAGAVAPSFRPIIVTVAVITTFTTPMILRAQARVVRRVDAAMPRRVQTLLALYEAWFEDLRRRPTMAKGKNPLRSVVAVVVLDGVLLIALTFFTVLWFGDAREALMARGLSEKGASGVTLTAALALAIPPMLALLRHTRTLGQRLADSTLSTRPGSALSVSTRWLLRGAAQVIVVIGVGVPMTAALQPLLGAPYVILGVVVLVSVIAVFLWRAAGRMDVEVRSSASRFLNLIARQISPEQRHAPSVASLPAIALGADHVHGFTLPIDAFAVGRTLFELNLRARTGASVVAIQREGHSSRVPQAREPLVAGDVLALAGSDEAIDRAQLVLVTGEVKASAPTLERLSIAHARAVQAQEKRSSLYTNVTSGLMIGGGERAHNDGASAAAPRPDTGEPAGRERVEDAEAGDRR